jgi:hypothetical protein
MATYNQTITYIKDGVEKTTVINKNSPVSAQRVLREQEGDVEIISVKTSVAV